MSALFACCVRRRKFGIDERNCGKLMEAPEISWENTLGAPNGIPFDEDTKELLKSCMNLPMPPPTNLSTIIKKSDAFPIKFPVDTIKCQSLKERGVAIDILEFNVNSTYPIIHEAMLPLIAAWLRNKREEGTRVEKALYKNMNLIQFIQRLIGLRAVEFFGSNDSWRLAGNEMGEGGWETVGTDKENSPLILAKCLSYDEIKLSAMMVISSHTEFINNGCRTNRGVVADDPSSIQQSGVTMGVVGSRFERAGLMEYQDIMISPAQNNTENGYGAWSENAGRKRPLRVLWASFYGDEYHPLYEDAVKSVKSNTNKKYIALDNHLIFNVENYMKRTLLSVEIILLEANTRAEKQNTTAFIHVSGFGLGVWKVMKAQEIFFLKTFEIALKKMSRKLKYVSDIGFSSFSEEKCGNAVDGDYFGDVRIHFCRRDPHAKLVRASDVNKLLVVTYAGDGNAYPGNEFWRGFLTSSRDSATACSTQASELHNPRINPRACGASLHIASPEHGLLHIADYAKLHLA